MAGDSVRVMMNAALSRRCLTDCAFGQMADRMRNFTCCPRDRFGLSALSGSSCHIISLHRRSLGKMPVKETVGVISVCKPARRRSH
jgi:hypothetical protein